MFRLISIVIVLGIVAWLATRQVDDARQATRDAAKTAGAAGVEVDDNASPSQIAEQVGRQVDAQLQNAKARVDAFESAAGGSTTREDPSAE